MIKQMKNPNGTYRILLKDVDFELLWNKNQEPCLVGDLASGRFGECSWIIFRYRIDTKGNRATKKEIEVSPIIFLRHFYNKAICSVE